MNIFEVLTQQQTMDRNLYETLVHEQNAWVEYKSFIDNHLAHVYADDSQIKQLWGRLLQSKIENQSFKDYCYQIGKKLANEPELLQDGQFLQKSIRIVELYEAAKNYGYNYVSQFVEGISVPFQVANKKIYIHRLRHTFQKHMQLAEYDFIEEDNISVLKERIPISQEQQIDCLLILGLQLLQEFPVQIQDFQPFLFQLEQFYERVIVPTIDEMGFQNQKQLKTDLQRGILEIHSTKIIDNLFDLILYYPEGIDLILEFKQSIQSTQLFELMEQKLCGSISKRLLITGVITQSILGFYINVLKVLQIVDLHGQIFNKVTNPIKEYLLKRPDCLRCIIQLLTSENYDKMTSEKVIIPSQNNEVYSSDEEYGKTNTDYRARYQEKDLMSILISLYGSQEAFINEYQNMLAEKILGAKDFHIEDEIKNIELMKMRFGETQMQTSNIIVKDVKESKRVDMNVHSMLKQNVKSDLLTIENVHPLFLSKTYWPVNYEFKESFKLPPQTQLIFDEYSKGYEHLKIMRKLLWHYELGSVTLSLSFDNGDFEFRCLPIHAILLEHFDESKLNANYMIQSDHLAKEVEMTHEELKRRMSFWTHRGVIRAVPQGDMNVRPHVYKKQQSMNETDSEVVFYFPVKQYIPHHDESETNLLDELPDEILQSTQSGSLTNHIQHVMAAVLNILKTTGAKTMDRLQQLMRKRHAGETGQLITENQVKEAVKMLVNSEQIYLTGEIYTSS